MSMVASHFIDRLVRRGAVPSRLRSRARELSDWLRSRHHLAAGRPDRLRSRLAACVTPQDHYDFATEVFPSHQIRSEICGFLAFAAQHRPAVVVEIGTAEGGTNFLLGQAIPGVERVIGLDLFVANTRLLHEFNVGRRELAYVQGSSHDRATRERLRDVLGGRPIDLLFIDGDHTYEGARDDFLDYRELVREGGLIAFHDIVADHFTRFGRQTGRWAGDVPRLWQELRSLDGTREFVDDPEQDGLGIGVLRHQLAARLPESFRR